MAFLEVTDYNIKLRTYNLQKMIDEDATVLTQAEEAAISRIAGYLYERYDTAAIFGATGAGRHAFLVQCVVNIVIYDLHGRLPRVTVPKMVQDNYDNTIAYLEEVLSGKIGMELPRRKTESGKTKTLFRSGSVAKKSHF
jgi:phage gp36-like protein